MTFVQFEALLVSWLQSPGILPSLTPVIWEQQNAPRPTKGQYLSLYGPRVVPDTEVSEVSDGYNDSDPTLFNVSSSEQSSIFVTLTVHNDSGTITAQDLANKLRRVIRQLPARLALEPCAVVDTQSVQQVPQLLESQFENRFQFDIQFRLAFEDIGTIETIGSLEGVGTISGTITVPLSVPPA